MRSCWNW